MYVAIYFLLDPKHAKFRHIHPLTSHTPPESTCTMSKLNPHFFCTVSNLLWSFMPCSQFIMKAPEDLEARNGEIFTQRSQLKDSVVSWTAEGITWRKGLTNYVILEIEVKTMGKSIGPTSVVYNESYSAPRAIQQCLSALGTRVPCHQKHSSSGRMAADNEGEWIIILFMLFSTLR